MLHIVLTVVQVFAALGIIALVLLQRGKGADAGAGFGAGASGTVFGARGATTALSRATAIFAAVFMLNSLALAYLGTRTVVEQPKSILDQVSESVPAPAGTLPATPGVPAPAPSEAQPEAATPAPAPAESPGGTVPTPAP